jgi:RHS repeat-associated protein
VLPAVALYQKENPIFGASRLGVYTRAVGTIKPNVIPAKTSYEITDYLGNVRAVIQENPNLFSILLSYADYYAFGEQLPSRNTTSDYRYAFQGQELDKETGMEAFQLRLWDGRIGRWLSPDPYGQYASPYLGMGNNPIGMIDPNGGFASGPDNEYNGYWNDVTGKYEYIQVSNKGGEFYDVINHIGGSLAGSTDFVVNPYIKVNNNWFNQDDLQLDATIRRTGIGTWAHYSEAIIPGHFEEFIPVERLFAFAKYLKNVPGKIVGKAQSTGTKGHALVSKSIALIQALRPSVSRVTMDLGYKKLLGVGAFKYGPRPDVGVLFKNGTVKIYEVASKTDVTDILIKRNADFMITNGIKGKVEVSGLAKFINQYF